MGNANELLIKISGDISDLSEKFDAAKEKTEALSNAASNAAKYAGVAFAAFTAEIGLSLKAFGDSEAATKRLATAMQNAGVYSRNLEGAYKDQAAELQKLTGLDDDSIVAAQASLQQMIGQTEITKELTAAIADLSVGKEMDLQASAELIGKGINGQTAALKKLGIEIDEGLTKQQRMEQIIQKVNLAVGGQAAAANQGVGSVKGLTSAMGDLQENMGSKFAPVFERAVKSLTSFVEMVSSNDGLISFAAAIVAGGAALAGFVTVLGTSVVAINAANAAAAAFGVTLSVALPHVTAIAIAVTGLAAAIGYFATRQKQAVNPTDELSDKLARARKELDFFQEMMNKPGNDYLKSRVDGLRASVIDLEERLRKASAASNAGPGDGEQDAAKKAAADKAENEKRAREVREQTAQRVHQNLMRLQLEGASKERIELTQKEAEILDAMADEKNRKAMGSLQFRLDATRQSLEALNEIEYNAGQQRLAQIIEQENLQTQQGDIFRNEMLAQNAEFQALSAEQQVEFMQQNGEALSTQILTEKTAREQAARDRLQSQITEHNEFLKNQQKFGTAYALINKIMHSEIYQGTKSAFGDLASLQSSSNSTLKAIGKGAALVNIAMKTAESAMNIYAGFSTIPIVGPALGVAGAAAAVAFGAEQTAKVTAMADGGLLTGGIPGRDSIPVLAMPGELVVPTRNFDEVVNAVAARRAAGIPGSSGESAATGGIATVVLQLKDELMDFIEAKLIERRALGIAIQGA